MSASTFSYAQAAKGRAPASTQQASSTASATAPPSESSQTRDDANASASESAPTTAPQSVASHANTPARQLQPGADEPDASQKPDTESVDGSATAVATAPELSSSTPRDDAASVAESQGPAEKPARASAPHSKSADGGDGKKGRKGKKSRNSDKDSEQGAAQEKAKEPEAPPVELTEAPVPSVNIWQQRAHAQSLSKPKTNAAPEAAASAAGSSEDQKAQTPSSSKSEEQHATAPSTQANKHARRPVDSARQGGDHARRGGPRGHKQLDKDGKEILPSVEDAKLWPTPETAAVAVEEEKRKPTDTSPKSSKDAPDESAAAKPRHKKEWINMNIVPSVQFQTPLPNVRNTNRSSRSTRGGRDAGGRGAHSAAASSAERSNATSSTPRVPENRERVQNGVPARSHHVPPHPAKRGGPLEPAHERGPRRPVDRAREPPPEAVNKTESVKADHADGPARGPNGGPHPRAQPERRHDLPVRGVDGVASTPAPPRERGEGRGGRGGRGGHRGGANGPVGHHGQSAFSHPYGSSSLSSRNSNPVSPSTFSPFGPHFGPDIRRGRKSGSAAGSYRHQSNGNGLSHKAPPMQAPQPNFEFAMPQAYGYSYGSPWMLDPTRFSSIISQVEYYFSVDNLCKDYYLRRHLDSEGFVRLAVVANFNRIKLIAPHYDWIRAACEESEKLELIQCEDGQDRVRPREKWQQFLLKPEDREEEARSGPPGKYWFRSKHMRHLGPAPTQAFDGGYPAMAAPFVPAFSPNSTEPMFAVPNFTGGQFVPQMNGVSPDGHAHHGDTQLSAAVPEFSPSGGVGSSENLSSWNTKTDDQVAALCVIIHEPNKSSQPNGFKNESEPLTNGVHDEQESPSASSHDASKGQSSEVTWFTEKKAAGQTANYLDLRARGLSERQTAKPGELPRDMKELYMFWQSFLTNDFNAGLYEEFRSHALKDASQDKPNTFGLQKLLAFYNEVLHDSTHRVWSSSSGQPEALKSHHVEAQKLSNEAPISNGVKQN